MNPSHALPPHTALPSPLRRPAGSRYIEILDQTCLPHHEIWRRIENLAEAAHAIRSMQVRGAPLIGITAAYGVALAMEMATAHGRAEAASDHDLTNAIAQLAATRPTAINLNWALSHIQAQLQPLPAQARPEAAWAAADQIAQQEMARNEAIGTHGLRQILETLAQMGRGIALSAPPAGHPQNPGRVLQWMTHCNAGSLATVGPGTALAPIYQARQAGIPQHVWVSETRPRNQGLLTAWELHQAGIPHTLIADNAAGLLIQQGQVDVVITGADRIARNGDVANKVGTYLKALACADAGIPFYVAAPRSTLDFACPEGAAIPIEERAGDELRCLQGLEHPAAPRLTEVRQYPATSPVYNPAFDITPARLVTALITERGCCSASTAGLLQLYPEEQGV